MRKASLKGTEAFLPTSRASDGSKVVWTRHVWAISILSLAAGCGPATVPCGGFSFTSEPYTRGIDMTLSFDFAPSACDASCSCNTVVYIQIVRVIDLATGEYLAPGEEQAARIVTGSPTPGLNGWAVDRLEGRAWGYYGRYDDGSFAETLTPGSNTADAILRDMPSGWPDRTWLDFLSVPVCIAAGSSCVNQLVGYYYWLFLVGTNGVPTDPLHKVAVEWHRDAFDEAIDEWNEDAASLGKNAFPALTRMGS